MPTPRKRFLFSAAPAILYGLLACEPALADIPPPLPTIPSTEITAPTPVSLIIGGLLLSLSVTALGLTIVRRWGTTKNRWLPMTIGIILLALTGAAAVWSSMQYGEHQRQRDSWQPLGPVEETPPVG